MLARNAILCPPLPARSSAAAVAALAVLAGTAQAVDFSWIAPVSGAWSTAANWSPVAGAPPDRLADTATIGLAQAFEVHLSDRRAVGSLMINNPAAALVIGLDGRLDIGAGGVINAGTIRVIDGGSLTFVDHGGSAARAIAGTGETRLLGRQAEIDSTLGVTVTLAPTATITGHGKVNAAMVIEGTIIADSAGGELALDGANKTNRSTLRARNGGTLTLNTVTVMQDAGASIVAETGSLVLLDACTLTGGSLVGLGGVFAIQTPSTISGVSIAGDVGIPAASSLLVLGQTLAHTGGTITVGGAGPIAGTSEFVCFEPLALTGHGTMVMSPAMTPDGLAIQARLSIGAGAALTLADGYTLAGTGEIAGDLVVGSPGTAQSLVDPGAGGATGSFSVVGDLTCTSGGRLRFDLVGPLATDAISVTGAATLAGVVEVRLASGFEPMPGASFVLVPAATVSGEPTALLPTLANGHVARLRVSANGLEFRVGLCAADYNADGLLDADDLSDYITAYFGPGPASDVDINGDGQRNADDLSDMITAYFAGC